VALAEVGRRAEEQWARMIWAAEAATAMRKNPLAAYQEMARHRSESQADDFAPLG